MKAAIYTRVSTRKQTTDRQITELQEYAKRNGYEVIFSVSETVSGSKNKYERPGLKRIFELAKKGDITEVLSLELSRLGRNAMDVREIILDLADLGVCTHIVNKNLRSLDNKRKKDNITMLILGVLADLGEMEKETLTERVISGLEQAKRKGKILGRPEGTIKEIDTLLTERKDVIRYLKAGRSIRETSKICGVAPNTVMKVKKALNERAYLLKDNRKGTQLI
ncbi:recombinase family protein [Rufibacter aurantiacus]|uniref:recombinase family protein n=1 Tax=Rufibacter aurantiacus TaxID=2817374 RepID=UPI001B30D54B|nr:recombinase family protein [Rufibacter aurantiacus]